MRLWPQTLLGRLLILLLGGLLAAQLAAGWILWQDRSRMTLGVVVSGLAERLASSLEELETLTTDERRERLRGRGMLRPTLDQPWRDDPPESYPAGRLQQVLQERMAGDRDLQVWVEEPAGEGGRLAEMHERHHQHHGGAMRLILVQARLDDDTVLTLRQPVPSEALSWPQRLLAALAVFTLSVLLIAGLAVRGLTRPLRTLARAAENLGRDLNHPPLPEQGSREVRQATRAFNAMQQRLRENLQQRGQMLAAVSHDLKTPITRLRLRAEMLPDDTLRQRFQADLAEMEKLVQSTLDFMRGDHLAHDPEPVELMGLLRDVAEEAGETGGKVQVSGSGPVYARGEPLALKRCLGNLIDNAVRYGGGATVWVSPSGDTLCVHIRDQGPGIPEADLERVFDPYYRLDASRSAATGGTGLGLGIARNIARAHGGELSLHNTDTGLEARLVLPAHGEGND
ncbi:signal transduction histidine kinase [Alkalispirillum mobile]|uniref:histidine kinase n=1 Tax=Alkalispirillum mobile TaxID=85925 RepID=A0A498C7L3_9GAMM|nr:ATP-binding protein [Alkalispirillum mobile]RLK50116.1 signal transduction histidine kinase [Alkalispirillum mobile]